MSLLEIGLLIYTVIFLIVCIVCNMFLAYSNKLAEGNYLYYITAFVIGGAISVLAGVYYIVNYVQ